jgi:CRP-like cAMP-binding protein
VDDVLALCSHLAERDLAEGAELMAEGTRSVLIHVLVSGTVGIYVGRVLVKRVSDPGSFLGEISALLEVPHTARVVALTPCQIRTMAADAVVENPEVLLAVARLLAARLSAMTGYLVDLRNQYADSGTQLGLMSDVLSELTSVRPSRVTLGSERADQPDY